jgi:hypothetical protein
LGQKGPLAVYGDLDGTGSMVSSGKSTVSGHQQLHRRNTLVVILIAIALMAAIAVCVGVAVFFTHHKGITICKDFLL